MINLTTALKTAIYALGGSLILACSSPTEPTTYLRNQSVGIKTLTDEVLTYIIDRPEAAGQYPILMTIDGSTCRGARMSGIDQFLVPNETSPRPYARIYVTKTGVGPNDDGTACTEAFLKTYSVDQRLTDHLRVLQHLRATANWWDGQLYIFGWSEGGDIGARLTAYYPNVDRAILGGFGGGTTMFEQFRDIFICPKTPEQTPTDREACTADITQKFETMRDNPTWKRSWAGDDNTYRVWATRLYGRQANILADTQMPILIVHGSEDKKSVHVSSARKLVETLTKESQANITYWEISDMEHSLKSLPEDRKSQIETAMRDWLLVGDSIKIPEPE